jgi:hypothetical protein
MKFFFSWPDGIHPSSGSTMERSETNVNTKWPRNGKVVVVDHSIFFMAILSRNSLGYNGETQPSRNARMGGVVAFSVEDFVTIQLVCRQ